MNASIGLAAPITALFTFAAVFNPWLLPYLPTRGVAKLIVSPQTFFLISSLAIMIARNLRPKAVGFPRQRVRNHVVFGLILGASPAILTLVGGLILMAADQIHPFLPRTLLGGPPLAVRIDTVTLVSLLIMAPVTEELFFRGILLKALREEHSALTATLLSAVIFMGGHGGFAVGPLLLGLITAPVRLYTGSIVPGMIFHTVCNAYGPILVRYFPNLYRYLDFFFQ